MMYPQISTPVRELAAADMLAFGAVGFAAQVLPATAAYRAIVECPPGRDAAELRAELTWLLENGSPAGRVYAATLIARLDPTAGPSAWQALADDDAALTVFSGCVMRHTTVAGYVRDHDAYGEPPEGDRQ